MTHKIEIKDSGWFLGIDGRPEGFYLERSKDKRVTRKRRDPFYWAIGFWDGEQWWVDGTACHNPSGELYGPFLFEVK